jgi:hypothetical protein
MAMTQLATTTLGVGAWSALADRGAETKERIANMPDDVAEIEG